MDSLYKEGHYNYYTKLDGKEPFSNYEYKLAKAKKGLIVIKEHISKTKDKRFLDVGCGLGIMVNYFSNYFKESIGIDEDKTVIKLAKSKFKKDTFIYGDGLKLPFKSNSFDVIACCQVYEHVTDYKKLFKEIYRVLKVDGICYLSAVNKYWVWEWHSELPFASFLPKKLSNIYIKAFGKGTELKETLISYNELKKALSDFKITDYTADIIKYPNKYNATEMFKGIYSIFPMIPYLIIKKLKPLARSFIFILEKKEAVL